jgi:uncharacterized membrane protein YhiD involved in acid resistance
MKKSNLTIISSILAVLALTTIVNAQTQEIPFFSEILSEQAPNPNASWDVRVLEITFRLVIAVVLSVILAFRPRRNVPLFQRNLYVAQTQILLAVVAAALMMIVGDSAARAFGIFAAVSLVRFRTNIRDPKEITVLLISLALGLAAGVGRWELGAVLCFFAVGLLWLLEHNESEQVFRPMELTVKTYDVNATQEMLEKIFKNYKLEAEIREIDPPDEKEPVGAIMYFLNLPLNLSTDQLSDQLLGLLKQVEGIEWKQLKHATDIYQ